MSPEGLGALHATVVAFAGKPYVGPMKKNGCFHEPRRLLIARWSPSGTLKFIESALHENRFLNRRPIPPVNGVLGSTSASED
jgi:hypothetical protein